MAVKNNLYYLNLGVLGAPFGVVGVCTCSKHVFFASHGDVERLEGLIGALGLCWEDSANPLRQFFQAFIAL